MLQYGWYIRNISRSLSLQSTFLAWSLFATVLVPRSLLPRELSPSHPLLPCSPMRCGRVNGFHDSPPHELEEWARRLKLLIHGVHCFLDRPHNLLGVDGHNQFAKADVIREWDIVGEGVQPWVAGKGEVLTVLCKWYVDKFWEKYKLWKVEDVEGLVVLDKLKKEGRLLC